MDRQSEIRTQRTEHAMLVPWGYFSRFQRLAERLRQQVSMPRHHENVPVGDVILEFGLLLLSGSTQLQDLNLGPRPLVKDEAVREAWDISQFVHYTSVSRVLAAAPVETVTQVVAVLDGFSRPFIEREVAALAAQGQPLLLHADLSGRQVSSYSRSYPQSRWGHMGNSLALGHQHALITLQGQSYRLHLAGFLHPGDTVSEACLRELIQASEQRLGCRPRRRVELLQARLEALQQQVEHYQCRRRQQEQDGQASQDRQEQLRQRLLEQELLLRELEERQGDKPAGPYSRLSKARQQKATCERQMQRAQQQAQTAQRRKGFHQRQLERLLPQKDALEQWLAVLQADNAANPNPIEACMHLDGGFSGGDNLAYLIELGYDVLAASKGTTTLALQKELPTPAHWETASSQVRLWEGPLATVGSCPYPLRRILQHWQAGDKQRYSTLLQYPAESSLGLPEVFRHYHRRQHAEAGIKQGKNVFGGRGVRIRSAAGLELLNQFAFVFWPNFVHWATDWLRSQIYQSSRAFDAALATVKTQVRVGTQTTATVFIAPGSRGLVFSDDGPYPNVRLRLEGTYAFQLPLPLFRCEPAAHMRSKSLKQLIGPPDA